MKAFMTAPGKMKLTSDLSTAKEPWEHHAAALHAAGTDEKAFHKAHDALRADKTITKPHLEKIVKSYVGYHDRTHGVEKMHNAIKTRFHGKVYDRDADAMARKATPW